MSAPRPDVSAIACPRCGFVMGLDEVGPDHRCVSCQRVLPPSHLPARLGGALVVDDEGLALPSQLPEGRRPTRESRAYGVGRAIEEERTRVGRLPGPPTVNDTVPMPNALAKPPPPVAPPLGLDDDGPPTSPAAPVITAQVTDAPHFGFGEDGEDPQADRTLVSNLLPPGLREELAGTGVPEDALRTVVGPEPRAAPKPVGARPTGSRRALDGTEPTDAAGVDASRAREAVGRTTDLERAGPGRPRVVQREALRDADDEPLLSRPEVTEPVQIAQAELTPGMRLGGYELVRRIGTGGMGTVWMARQLSLDRHVALKLLHGEMASDPSFVVRFNREAVAAGQLVHHNIVQIHDTGADKGVHFFSMEFVDGETLGQLVRREGRLDPEVAAGYILQAARGLHYAHQQGMVHRDVKPDNLLLNGHGVVKLADLGLVKLRGALLRRSSPGGAGESTSLSEVSMGTPAYIAPEQVQDPAGVDQRADIYSLGCTLYELLTGRPPFEGESVAVVLTKHVYDAPVPAQDLARRVPPALAEIVSRMMAKSLDERFGSMSAVIRDLERYLGFDGSSAFSPREEHADQLERNVERFNASLWSKRRKWSLLGALGATAVALGVLCFLRLWLWVGLVAGGALVLLWTAFVLRGLMQQTALFLRVRQLVLGAPLAFWFLEFLAVGGGGYALWHHRLHWHAAGTAGVGVLLAFAWYFLLDRKVAAERRPQVEEIERMLRSIRLRGLDENALRQFVSKYSGEVWEPFYEQLFGYDAMLTAREKWGRNDRGLPRKRHAVWRDPLIRFIDGQQQARKERAARRLQRKLERRRLKAEQTAALKAAKAAERAR